MKSITHLKRLRIFFFTAFLTNFLISVHANDSATGLTIRNPATGDLFTAPAAIRIELVAVDANGDIRHVEFFANEHSIGRSDQWTKDAVIPGKPREHFLEWTNVSTGEYKIVGKATDTLGANVESDPVSIAVLTAAVVSIEATVPQTSEPSPLTRIIPGQFTLTRTGEAKNELSVFINVSGTATPDQDYAALPEKVTFPAGTASVQLSVNAIDDELVEGDESVIATLVYPSVPSPFPPAYSINPEKSSSKVVIHDPDSADHATLVITSPHSGENFHFGATITINATAIDPQSYLPRVEFYDFEQRIGVSEIAFFRAPDPGTPIYHTFEWTGAAVGKHSLTARAFDSSGAKIVSEPVAITVGDSPGATIVRVTIEDGQATELPPFVDAIDSAQFNVSREGDLTRDLAVFFSLHGTAAPEKDYRLPSSPVIIPAGETTTSVIITPISDEIAERMETVSLRLEPSPVLSPLPTYNFDPSAREAAVVIYDRHPPEGGAVEIAFPGADETFVHGETIPILAAAYHPTQDPSVVDFYDGEEKIGSSVVVFDRVQSGGLIEHRFEWKNPASGPHIITAQLVLPNGEVFNSSKIPITVGGGDDRPIVSIRFLPQQTLEPWPNADFAPGSVEISRSGSTAQPLLVFFELGGTATSGEDYAPISPNVLIGVGEESAHVKVDAIDDTLAEGDESVTFTLTRPPLGVDFKYPTNYQIDPEHNTASITILDNDTEPPRQVVLAIEARDGIAAEVNENGEPDTAVFVIKRVGGPNDVAVVAQYTLSGTAVNGIDYSELSGQVELPGGTMTAEIIIKPIPDKALEGEETVLMQLEPPVCPAIFPPPPSCYLIGEHGSARAVIRDTSMPGGEPPRVVITQPKDGAVFRLGQSIEISALATDADGSTSPTGNIERLDIFADGVLLDSTKLSNLTVTWSEAKIGAHKLTARALDGQGIEGNSEPVRIMVIEGDSGSFVKRELPGGYLAGSGFTVWLAAQPADGTSAYTIEEKPPEGWSISAISDEGVFDHATGKVKFGPFLDAKPRRLSYEVLAPANASGRYEFSGTSSANGKAYPITGDRVIGGQDSLHPADSNAESAISQVELTAYAAAWKNGGSWPHGPVPIPLTYVTRAGMLWRRGEAYIFDAAQGAPPACWISPQPQPLVAIATTPSTAERVIAGSQQPGAPLDVKITVTPGRLTSAYALAEKLPHDWVVSNVSGEGRFDAETSSIRWGLFLGDSERVLTYRMVPPAGVASVCRISGSISFDGSMQEISGSNSVVAVNADTRLTLPGIEKGLSDSIMLQLSGPIGQVCVLEVSTDLQTWEQLGTVFLPDGNLHFEQPAAQTQRYYRLHVQ